jgi:universal stress protein A
MPIRRILVPTDFSACSKQALVYAYELAQRLGAQLVLLHVVEELPPYIGFLPPREATKTLAELQCRTQLALAQLLPERRCSKVEVVCQAVVGTSYPTIIEVAQETKADVIVLATHGRTGWRRFAMGSVAERLVRTAPCPVLTIRPAAVPSAGAAPATDRRPGVST